MPRVGNAFTGQISATSSTVACTVNRVCAVGETIIGAIAMVGSGSVFPTITVSDTRGNTWQTDGAGVINGTTVSIRMFSTRVTTALQIGDTVTVTMSNTRVRAAVIGEAFDDVDTGTRLDQHTTAASSGTTLSVGPTGVTTEAEELVVAAFGYAGLPPATMVAGAGYTASQTVGTSAGSSDRGVALEWKYVNATGTQTADATVPASTTWVGQIATYKATLAPPPPGGVGTVNVRLGANWVACPVMVREGANWVERPLKVRQGVNWVAAG